MGVAVTANKYKGVYAAVVESKFAAEHCRLINDCNVICMGGYILGEYMALEIARAFINTKFAADFTPVRKEYLQQEIKHIEEIENVNFR